MYTDGKMLPPPFPITEVTTKRASAAFKSGVLSVMAFHEKAGLRQVDLICLS